MKFSLAAVFLLAASPALSIPTVEAQVETQVEPETHQLEARAIPGPVKNDYPYSGKCSGADPWAFFKCQCTSFVAYRINKRLGIKFTNHYKGHHWGNANSWDEAARASGVTINNTPKPGSIAQTNAGSGGHVAWVTKVSGNKVTVEEYNYAKKKAYATRTVAKSTFKYIHIKV